MIEINGKVYRTLPEQVDKNKEDIAELQKKSVEPEDYAEVKAQVTTNKTDLSVYKPKVNSNTSDISKLKTNIADEISARQSKDSELQSAINSEEDARVAAYTKLNNEKQDKLTAGDNITITDNVISAKASDNYWNLTDKIIKPVDTVDSVQVNNLSVLNAGGLSCASPTISGVASCSAIDSTTSLNLSAKNRVNISIDGQNVAALLKNFVVLSPSTGVQMTMNTSTGDFDRYLLYTDNYGNVYKTTDAYGTINPKTGLLECQKLQVTSPVSRAFTTGSGYPGIDSMEPLLAKKNTADITVANQAIYSSAQDGTVPTIKYKTMSQYIDTRNGSIVTNGDFVAGNLGYDGNQAVYSNNSITRKKYFNNAVTNYTYYFPSEGGTLELAGKYWLQKCDIYSNVLFFFPDASNMGLRANLPAKCTITSISVSETGASRGIYISNFTTNYITVGDDGTVTLSKMANDNYVINGAYTVEGVGHVENVLTDADTYKYSFSIQDIKEDGTATYKVLTATHGDTNEIYSQVILITFPPDMSVEETIEASEYTKELMVEF